MARRVSFSKTRITANEVADHHAVVDAAIHLYYAPESPNYEVRFEFYTEDEVLNKRDERLFEAETASSMMVLASIEAALKVDYLQRCYARYRDQLSRTLRLLYQDKGEKVSLSDDLLDAWKNDGNMTTKLVGDFRSAFGYRHWLAHGRYYVAKLGREYDFASVYDLAKKVEAALTSQRPSN